MDRLHDSRYREQRGRGTALSRGRGGGMAGRAPAMAQEVGGCLARWQREEGEGGAQVGWAGLEAEAQEGGQLGREVSWARQASTGETTGWAGSGSGAG
jgi:hypothetical protein